MKYYITIADNKVFLAPQGGAPVPLAEWLKVHIPNQTATAAEAGIDRYSINLACKGVRQIGHEKFFKLLATMGAAVELPASIEALPLNCEDDYRELILHCGHSQRAIARAAGLSAEAISGFVRGKFKPLPNTLARIAAAIGQLESK